ncbi:hypothetical protein HDU93_007406 [Gonapodya sp. JEL0774]|nr:hypothetical protein HDU93_007406 [Gonapodya sp. JEL0774]
MHLTSPSCLLVALVASIAIARATADMYVLRNCSTYSSWEEVALYNGGPTYISYDTAYDVVISSNPAAPGSGGRGVNGTTHYSGTDGAFPITTFGGIGRYANGRDPMNGPNGPRADLVEITLKKDFKRVMAWYQCGTASLYNIKPGAYDSLTGQHPDTYVSYKSGIPVYRAPGDLVEGDGVSKGVKSCWAQAWFMV